MTTSDTPGAAPHTSPTASDSELQFVLSPTQHVTLTFDRQPTVRDLETLITFLDVTRVAVAQWPLWVKVECGGGTPPEPDRIRTAAETVFATEPRGNVASRRVEVEPNVAPLQDFIGTVFNGGTLTPEGFAPSDRLTLYPEPERPGVPPNVAPMIVEPFPFPGGFTPTFSSMGGVVQSLGPVAAEPIVVDGLGVMSEPRRCAECGERAEEGSTQCASCNYADNLSSRNE